MTDSAWFFHDSAQEQDDESRRWEAETALVNSSNTKRVNEMFGRLRDMIVDPCPEPCLAQPCRSPVACNGFGYCRERNDGRPTGAELDQRRAAATVRKGAG